MPVIHFLIVIMVAHLVIFDVLNVENSQVLNPRGNDDIGGRVDGSHFWDTLGVHSQVDLGLRPLILQLYQVLDATDIRVGSPDIPQSILPDVLLDDLLIASLDLVLSVLRTAPHLRYEQ